MSSSESLELSKKTINMLLGLLFLPLIIVFRGFVLSRLWTWFVVPFGLRSIAIPEAAGLIVIAQLFSPRSYNKKEEFEGLEYISVAAGIILLSWGVGYIIHLFMKGN